MLQIPTKTYLHKVFILHQRMCMENKLHVEKKDNIVKNVVFRRGEK